MPVCTFQEVQPVSSSEIFTPNTADLIQHISLPLEFLGLSMVYIEVRHPRLADRMEEWVDTHKKNLASTFWWGVVIAVSLIALAYWGPRVSEGLALVGRIGGQDAPAGTPGAPLKLLAALFFAATFSIMTILGLNRLEHFAHGRALGAAGLIHATLGLLGEVYQVITIHVH